jgi:signal peptidase II
VTLKERIIADLKDISLVEYFGLIFLNEALLVADILSKYFAYQNMILGYQSGNYPVYTAIPYLFDFTLVFNNGAAWNLLADQKWILCFTSAIVGLVLLYLFLFRFTKMPKFCRVAFSLMIAGCFGNLIDRIGYWGQLGNYKEGVIDFIMFDFWKDFPIFNLADSYLVIGIAVIIVGYLVYWIKSQKAGKAEKKESAGTSSEDDADLKAKLLAKQADKPKESADKEGQKNDGKENL